MLASCVVSGAKTIRKENLQALENLAQSREAAEPILREAFPKKTLLLGQAHEASKSGVMNHVAVKLSFLIVGITL